MSNLSFGTDAVDGGVFTNSGLMSSTSSFVAERRAYAIFRSTKQSVCEGITGNPTRIENSIITTDSYENILDGPRLVPRPSLTSVEWSFDGANNIYDGYLWKATVNFTCYSPGQFNSFDKQFFQHLNRVELQIGWLNADQNPITINGSIVDFQFSINEKLHYDCSVTFAGIAMEAAAAFDLNLMTPNTTEGYEFVVNGQRFIVRPQSIVGSLKAAAKKALKNFTPPQGGAKGNDAYGRAIFLTNASSWLFWGATKEVYYVSLEKLITKINNNLPKDNGFEGINLNIEQAKKITTKIKSANPVSVLNQGDDSATYVNPDANFWWQSDFGNGARHYFISFDTLEKIEKELVEDKSDNPHATKNTLIQFIKRVLDEINSCLGESIKLEMIPYGQSGESAKHGFEIVDRKTLIKKLSFTEVNPLAVNSTVRSISVQSTVDSEMASIALSSAQSGKNQGFVAGLFGCTPTPLDIREDQDELATMYASFKQLDETILSDCIQTLKKICNVGLPQINGYKYGVTVTLTVDGYPAHLFGKTFTMKGLPTMLTRSNVYFIVLKQGHKFSNGDWTMDLEGQMMFDVDGKLTEGWNPTEGAIIKVVPVPEPTAQEWGWT